MHGGSAPQVRSAARRRLAVEEITREIGRLGMQVPVDPLDAMLEQVEEAYANVAVLRLAVAELGITVANDGAVAVPDPDGWEAREHVLVAMYHSERDRLMRFSKLCLDAGVDERRVRLAEAQGQLLARVVQAAVDACNPTAEGRAAAMAAAAREMRAIGTGDQS